MATLAPSSPTRTSVPRALGQVLVAPLAPRTHVALVHLVLDLVSACILSTPVLVLAVLSVVTLPVIPVSVISFLCLLVAARLVGHIERFRLAAVPGVLVTNPHKPLEGPWYSRGFTRLRTAATWKEIGYHLVHLPKAVIFVAVALGTWALGVALATLPLYVDRVPAGRADILWWDVEPGGEAAVAGVVGIGLLFTAPWVTRGLSRLTIGMADGLLGGSEAEELRERVGDLEASRAGVVDAAEAERRRIERDLHDGAQQRLVALAMSLGLAKEKLDDDPVAARALIDEAHREAKNALVELRDLARGLHPPVLTDRGLTAAVAGLAGRAPLPVEVDVRVERRCPPSIEGIAYFVISEALTNVARHSGARRARILVADTGPTLLVEVSDDGVGGAHAERGSGLRGLADRVAAVDGTFLVTSPPGGPTSIRAELPLPFATTPPPAPDPPTPGAQP